VTAPAEYIEKAALTSGDVLKLTHRRLTCHPPRRRRWLVKYHEPQHRVSEPLRSAVGRPGGGLRSRTDNRVSAKSR
jgi:hypothetical protein